MLETFAGEVIGVSSEAERLRAFVERAAQARAPVLLAGEPGTGKQTLARLIHDKSSRRSAPFLMVDCSLYYERELKRELFGYATAGAGKKAKKGLLEFAGSGTCYLSRIEELSPVLQESLLELLRSGRFTRLGDGKTVSATVRLIASSEKNLGGFVDAGLFHAELHRELGAQHLHVPALRERRQDIQIFLHSAIASLQPARPPLVIAPEALQALEAYPWPNNFDDLFKEAERLLRSGTNPVRPENLAMEISSYWLGQHGDPAVRKVLEELDGYLREFLVMSRLDLEYTELVGWTAQHGQPVGRPRHNPLMDP